MTEYLTWEETDRGTYFTRHDSCNAVLIVKGDRARLIVGTIVGDSSGVANIRVEQSYRNQFQAERAALPLLKAVKEMSLSFRVGES